MTDPSLPGEAKQTLQLTGNSLPQLFENAAQEILNLWVNSADVGEALREKVVIEADDASGLLQEWIKTLLKLATEQHLLFRKCRFQAFELERTGKGHLRAEMTGELIDPLRHTLKNDPAQMVCGEVQLLNSSKSIEAQVVLISRKIPLAK